MLARNAPGQEMNPGKAKNKNEMKMTPCARSRHRHPPAPPGIPLIAWVITTWVVIAWIITASAIIAVPGLAQALSVDVHAHRGGAAMAPENTLAAVRNALALGVDVIELDLHVSRDGAVVVIHDATLERTTTGRGFVRETALADLRRLDAGTWFHARFAGERVPTLREVLEVVKGHGNDRVRLNLETKYDARGPGPPSNFEELVLEQLRAAGMLGRTIIQSFHYPSIVRVKALDSSLTTAALRSPLNPPLDPVADVRAAHADVYSPGFRLVTREALEALHRAGVPVVPWTVNEPADMERLLALGIGALRGDGIITDHPDRLIQVLRARGLRR